MKTLIESYLPVFPGFYESIFQPNEDTIIEHSNNYDDYEFDYDQYYIDAAKACVNAIEFKLQDLGFKLNIEYQGIGSPKYYNFSNDCINVKYVFKPGCITAIKAYLNTNRDQYAIYLKNKYSSCSGFISSYSNDIYEWLTYMSLNRLQRNTHYAGSVFEFIMENEQYDQMELYNDSIDSQGVYLDGWLKEVEIESFEENGIQYNGNRDELYADYEYDFGLDSKFNTVSFPEWLNDKCPVIEPVFIDPNQLSFQF